MKKYLTRAPDQKLVRWSSSCPWLTQLLTTSLRGTTPCLRTAIPNGRPSWDHLQTSLASRRAIPGPSWNQGWASWGPPGPFWGNFAATYESSWAPLQRPRTRGRLQGPLLGPSWAYLGAVWGINNLYDGKLPWELPVIQIENRFGNNLKPYVGPS